MWYTYTVTAGDLEDLDELLAATRRAVQRPGYRWRLLHGIDLPGGIATLRLLRAVELLGIQGEPSIKDVAARLGIEHSTASRAVDQAVRNGLLTKRGCADDLRRARLTLSASGRAVLAKASTRRRDLLESITEGWSEQDVSRLVQLLQTLLEGFDRLEETSP